MVYKYEVLQTEPTTSSLKRIAEELEVSADYLLGLAHTVRGQAGENAISDEDRALLDVFHREGWPGLIHMGTDFLAGRKPE
jgi:hypothetical protein